MFWKSWRYIIDLVVVVITWNSVCVFGLIRLRLHQQWFFLSCFPVWIISGTFYDFHAKKKKIRVWPEMEWRDRKKTDLKESNTTEVISQDYICFCFFFSVCFENGNDFLITYFLAIEFSLFSSSSFGLVFNQLFVISSRNCMYFFYCTQIKKTKHDIQLLLLQNDLFTDIGLWSSVRLN